MSLEAFRPRNVDEAQVPALRETLDPEVLDIYVQYGHGVPDVVRAATINKWFDMKIESPESIARLCKEIEASRMGKTSLSSTEFMRAASLGLKNLEAVSFKGDVEKLDLKNANLRNADLTRTGISNSNFSGANLTNANLDHTLLMNSLLDTAILPVIKIGKEEMDLRTREIFVSDSNAWDLRKVDIRGRDVCQDCEYYNGGVITKPERNTSLDSSWYARRGVLIFQEGKPLGVMKLKGENTFLALRTVQNLKGETILHKGMVYGLEQHVMEWLRTQSTEYREQEAWRRVDVEKMALERTRHGVPLNKLGRNNLRFIADPELYEEMDQLVDRLEANTEPTVDLIKKRSLFSFLTQ